MQGWGERFTMFEAETKVEKVIFFNHFWELSLKMKIQYLKYRIETTVIY